MIYLLALAQTPIIIPLWTLISLLLILAMALFTIAYLVEGDP